jgi:hypothetical protein
MGAFINDRIGETRTGGNGRRPRVARQPGRSVGGEDGSGLDVTGIIIIGILDFGF